MTTNNFLIAIEGYYENYKPAVKKAVGLYLSNTFKENDLSKILDIIFKNHSRQYKCTPDIAIIEKIINEYNDTHDYPGERIVKINECKYITDNPQFDYLFNGNNLIEDKQEE